MTAATLTVANALKSIVSATFSAVGFVTAATPETAVQAKHLPAGLRPPCVLILAGDGVYTDSTLTRRQQFHLILIDVLAGTNDARTAAALGRFDTLQELFPSEGLQSGDVVFIPESFRLLDCPDSRAAACLTVAALSPAQTAGSVSGSTTSTGSNSTQS